MKITYKTNRSITADQFKDILLRSTLGERRPIHKHEVLESMLKHSNLLCTAWDEDKLVGVARSITDFSYCCYLSDLAVDQSYQSKGIGTELIRLTQTRLEETAKIILLSAPKAQNYYPTIGFTKHESAWVVAAKEKLNRRTNGSTE